VLNLALNLAFMRPLQHIGPALASSIAAWGNVAALAFVLHRRGHFVVDAALNRRAARMLVASLAMAAVLLGVQAPLFALVAHHGLVLRLAALGVLVGAGMVAYGAAGQVLGAFNLRQIAGRFARRRRAAAEG
jgi:putative peptidoglycan lipid II flippase